MTGEALPDLIETGVRGLGGDPRVDLHAVVREMISRLRANPAGAGAVWHPLGCLYVEIAREPMTSVRLHVWGLAEGEYRSSGLGLHAHDFDLDSFVATGAMAEDTYEVDDGEPPTHSVYGIEYHDTVNVLRRTGRSVRGAIARTRRIETAERYTVPAGVFHHARPAAPGITLTFVAARRHAAFCNQVLGPVDGPSCIVTERVPCPTERLAHLLRRGAFPALDLGPA